MPIMTEYIHRMREIGEMNVSPQEKIVLLKKIELRPGGGNCLSCKGRRRAAQRLLEQMVDYEIKKLAAAIAQ